MIRVIKKDGTKEEFNVQKVVVAVNKSAYRALIKFTDEELQFICQFVEEEVKRWTQKRSVSHRCTMLWRELLKRSTRLLQKVIEITAIISRILFRC